MGTVLAVFTEELEGELAAWVRPIPHGPPMEAPPVGLQVSAATSRWLTKLAIFAEELDVVLHSDAAPAERAD